MMAWCSLLLAVLVTMVPLAAQTTDSLDDPRLLKTARTALSDGLFESAQSRAKEHLRRFSTSANKAEVQLIQAQALYYLGQTAAAQAVLNLSLSQVPEKLRGTYTFWQAEILLQAEKWAEAEKKYRDLLGLLPSAELVQSGQLGLAWTLFQQNKEKEARQLLETLQSKQGKTLTGQKAALLLARYLMSKQQGTEAAQMLELILTEEPAPETFFAANYWLGEIAQNTKKYPEAITRYTTVTSNPKAFPRSIVAQSWFGIGTSQSELGQHDKALQALEQAFTVGHDSSLKLASFRLYLQSAEKLQRLPEAQTKLREFAKKDVAPLTAAAALFAIGSSQATQNQPDQAISTFEAMLTAYPDTQWRSATQYQLGRLYQDKNQLEPALRAYQACLESGAEGVMLHQVEFNMGELYARAKDWPKAMVAFQKAVAAGGNVAEKSLFNLTLIHGQRSDLDAYAVIEAQLKKEFPQSPLLLRVTMEKARLLEAKGQVEPARQVYQELLAKNPDPTQRPLLLLRLGDLLYDSGQLAEALKLYDDLLANFPQDSRVAEAAYRAIWCNYLTKRFTVEQTRTALTELHKKYPQDSQASRVLFNAAEFYFNAQDFVTAQTKFTQVATDYPQSDLVDQAWFFAGRAALERKDYGEALDLLDRVPDKSSCKLDARILQGLVYHQQLRFENAITLFDAVLAAEKSGARFIEAALRKGDCLFALGGTDPARYEQAAAAFGLVLGGNQGNFAQRNEAAFKRAKCFAKVNRTTDALALYLEVLNGRTPSPTEPTSAEVELAPEMFWRVQAGLGAAELRQKQQDWRGALAVYRKLEQLGGPLQQEFRSTINQLRRDHFLYGEES